MGKEQTHTPTYEQLTRVIDELTEDDEGVDAGCKAVARKYARFLEAIGTPCPRIWWHGGDAIVFTWHDWHITLTSEGVAGLLDPLASTPPHKGEAR